MEREPPGVRQGRYTSLKCTRSGLEVLEKLTRSLLEVLEVR